MKRSKIMTIAMIMLVITLLSACIISGTLAKYTTGDSGADEATVAKFGVVAKIAGGLFNTKYGTDGKPVADMTGVVVSGSEDVVAPGTQSSDKGMTVSVKGTPEVKTKVRLNIKTSDVTLGSGSGNFGVMRKLFDSGSYTEFDFAEAKAQYSGSGEEGLYENTPGTGAYTKITEYDPGKPTLYGLRAAETTSAMFDVYQPVKANLSGSTGTTFEAAARRLFAELGISNPTVTTTAFMQKEFSGSADHVPGYAYNLVSDPITWKWALTTAGDDKADVKDTILGDLISGTAMGDGDAVVHKGYNGTGWSRVELGRSGQAGIRGDVVVLAQLKALFDVAVTVDQTNGN